MAEYIIYLLVGAATLLIGMNMMSSGLKKATGKSVKRLFKKTEDNRFVGIGIGAATTALIQSSAATSVMAIGFISAGAMTVFQGVSVILGAYLGTTITGLLVSLSSLNISKYLLLVGLAGVILTFIRNEKVKNIGEVLCGLGILFVGLELMKMAFPAGGELTNGVQALISVIKNPFLLLILGALFTALVQSSSATSGIVIVMVGTGAIDISSGFYLVLGATIGTVITTIIASIGGNVNVKRTAIICLVVRIISALIGMLFTIIFEDAFASFFATSFGSLQFGLATYLIMYNLALIPIVLASLKPIVKLFEKIIKDKDEEKKKKAIKYIDERLLNSPTLALEQAKKEIINMLNESLVNFKIGYDEIVNMDFSKSKELLEREETIDYINNKITDYLILLSNKVSMSDESIVGSYFHITNDIERIGDHANNFHDNAMKMSSDDLSFSDHAKEEFKQMYDIIVEMFSLCSVILKTRDKSKLPHLHELEDKTDKLKLALSDSHFMRIKNNTCKVELSPFYSTFLSELERVADHLVNVGYGIINPTGDDSEVL